MNKILLAAAVLLAAAYAQLSHAGETDLGPLYGFSQTSRITLEECRQNWRVTSRYTAECLVKKWHLEPAILLQSDTLVTQWKYDSGLKWRLTVNVRKHPNGYLVKIEGDEKMPKNRLEFLVAKKYVRSALEEWGTDQLTQRLMRVGFLGSGAGEVALGPMYSVTRTVDLKSANLVQSCLKNLAGNDVRRTCTVHFANYRNGEAIVNRDDLFVTVANKSKKLSISFWASPAWRGYGVFNLGYMRVDYTGAFDEKSFKTLFAQAVENSARKTFDFQLHKIGRGETKNATFRETAAKSLHLIERKMKIDVTECKNAWQRTSESSGQCDVNLYALPIITGDQTSFYEGQIAGRDGQALVILKPSQLGYLVEIYAPAKVLEKFENASPYIKRALQEAAQDTFINNSLK